MKKNKKTKVIRLSATDISAFHGCHHLTQLEKKVANNEIKRPHFTDPKMKALQERGVQHEKSYLEKLKSDGLTNVMDLTMSREDDFEKRSIKENASVEETLQAMRDGVDVIFQARFKNDCWDGIADFLVKVETPSNLGNYSYEVVDTKLSIQS